MSSLAVKFTSLAVRTLAKPIANGIKFRAQTHPRFRKLCIDLAQSIHRLDMRIRLNLLREPAAIQRAELDAEEAAKKNSHGSVTASVKEHAATLKKDADSLPTSSKGDATKSHSKSTSVEKPQKKKPSQPHIRPLSDIKAIERGATFISEAFLFTVAGGLILFEAIRSRMKESNRRDMIQDRIETLEHDNESLRTTIHQMNSRMDVAGIKILPEQPPQAIKRRASWSTKGGWFGHGWKKEDDSNEEEKGVQKPANENQKVIEDLRSSSKSKPANSETKK